MGFFVPFVVGSGGGDWLLSSFLWFGFFNPLGFLCQFGNTERTLLSVGFKTSTWRLLD